MQDRSIQAINPTISVVMPAYNAEKYLREAIDSILAQTFTDFEFIIINDGSTDTTKDVILSYSDPRIVYLENERNSGICATLNRGLDAARGRYIARMDADDISLPNRLAKQVAYMDTHPQIGVLGTDIVVFGDGIAPHTFEQVVDKDMCSAGLLFNPCFAHPTVMWRKMIMDESNLRYEDDYRGLEDLRMWWQFSKITTLTNIHIPLLKYRHHIGQETQKPNERKIESSNKFRTERYESFGFILTEAEKEIVNWYSYGQYSNFSNPELDTFIGILKRVVNSSHYPIKTSKKALKVVASKAIVYTICQSSKLKSDRVSLLTKAFYAGMIPPIWYAKYLKSFIL